MHIYSDRVYSAKLKTLHRGYIIAGCYGGGGCIYKLASFAFKKGCILYYLGCSSSGLIVILNFTCTCMHINLQLGKVPEP